MYNLEKYTTNRWYYHFEQVMKFNVLAGNTKKDKDFLVKIYEDLCEEEAFETICAYAGTDVNGKALSERESLKELIDGCCDLVYVAGFYSNFITKDLPDFVDLNKSLGVYVSKIKLASKRCFCSSTLLASAQEILLTLNIDHNKALDIVHESNLSKFIDVTGIHPEDIEEVASLECADIKSIYKEKGKDLKEVTYETVTFKDEAYLVFRNEDGKVIKPSSFVEPDIDKVIAHLFE